MSYKPSHGHRKIELAFHAIFNITIRIRYHGRREKKKRNSRFFLLFTIDKHVFDVHRLENQHMIQCSPNIHVYLPNIYVYKRYTQI